MNTALAITDRTDAIKTINIWMTDFDYWIDIFNGHQVILDSTSGGEWSPTDLKEMDRLQNIVMLYKNELLPDIKSRAFHLRDRLTTGAEGEEMESIDMKELVMLRGEVMSMEKTIKGYQNEFVVLDEKIAAFHARPHRIARLLLTTDFSEHSQHSVDYALSLFGATAQHIVLLTVVHSPFKSDGSGGLLEESAEETAQERLDAEMARLKSTFPEVAPKIEARHEIGFLIDKVRESITDDYIDLVVIGGRGESGLSTRLFGSNTINIIRQVEVPVLVVPMKSALVPPKRLLLATDMKLEQCPAHFDLFLALKQLHRSQVDILQVESPHSRLSSVHDKVKKENVLATLGLEQAELTIRESDEVKETIEEVMREKEIDLLCVIHHHDGWLTNVLGMSLTTEMIMDLDHPMLVIRK